jgi:hypothetical protein
MIARAARRCRARRARDEALHRVRDPPAGSGSPITPVEATRTCSAGRSSASATASTVAATPACPAAPVKALALPEFTRMA